MHAGFGECRGLQAAALVRVVPGSQGVEPRIKRYLGQSADKKAHGANARGILKSKALQESSITPLREETGDAVLQPGTRIDFSHCTGCEPQTSNPCGRDFENVKCLIGRIPRTKHFKNCGVDFLNSDMQTRSPSKSPANGSHQLPHRIP